MDAALDPTSPAPRPRALTRTVLLYLCLVGLPTLGLVGIVRAGRGITPPISVGGRWTLSVPPQDAPAVPALARSPDGAPPALVIVQSGVSLAVNLTESRLATSTARLDGNRLSASLAEGGSARLAIDGTVTKDGATPRLAGELRRLDCSACPAVPFIAERVAGPRG